jgi:hypothetical protein
MALGETDQSISPRQVRRPLANSPHRNDLNLNHIQIYPTNQYTPSVDRLLQVMANLYDTCTNRPATDNPFCFCHNLVINLT